MSSMQSAYFIIGGFALVALFIHMEWLFFLLLLAFGALLAADSLSHPPTKSHKEHGHGGHHTEPTKVLHAPPASFLDVLLANLIVGKHTSIQEEHRRHKEHGEHEKHRKHELEETKEHLAAQLKNLEQKISENVKAGNGSIVKELQGQRTLLKKKLNAVINILDPNHPRGEDGDEPPARGGAHH